MRGATPRTWHGTEISRRKAGRTTSILPVVFKAFRRSPQIKTCLCMLGLTPSYQTGRNSSQLDRKLTAYLLGACPRPTT